MTAATKGMRAPTGSRDELQAQLPPSGDIFGDPSRGVGIWLASGLRYAQWLQEIATLQSEITSAMAQNLVGGTTAILSAKSYEDCAHCQAQLVSEIFGTATSAAQKLADATRRCSEDVMYARPANSSSKRPRVGAEGEPIEVKTVAQ